jgi:FtsH-binding integral membrane protein
MNVLLQLKKNKGDNMDTIKKLFKFYSVKLIAILLVVMLLSYVFKIYVLSGIIMFVSTLYVFIKSFKDPNMKKKKLITKIFIYYFIVIFLISSILFLGGNPEKNSNVLRQELKK